MVGIIYYTTDPASATWMPQCYVRQLTGYDCPGCGAQRGLHALLHGEWARALSHNYLLAVAVPVALLYGVSSLSTRWQRLHRALESRRALLLYIVLIYAWWGLRNWLGV